MGQAEVHEDLLDHRGILDERDQLASPVAQVTYQGVDSKDPLHQFRPRVIPRMFTRRHLLGRVGRLSEISKRASGLSSMLHARVLIRDDLLAQRRGRGEDTMISSQVDTRARYQCSKSFEKDERFEQQKPGPVVKGTR